MDVIDLSAINYGAVVVAALAHMAVGLVWFSRPLFGNVWAELTGKDLTPAWPWIPLAIVGHLSIAFVLAIFLQFANVTTIPGGLAVALLVWFGFVATLEIGELVWEKIPFRLFLLRVGNHLVALSLAGGDLGRLALGPRHARRQVPSAPSNPPRQAARSSSAVIGPRAGRSR